MFKGLRDRAVIINGTRGESWAGKVVSESRTEVRLDDWSYADPGQALDPQAGIARLPLSSVAWIIEVP